MTTNIQVNIEKYTKALEACDQYRAALVDGLNYWREEERLQYIESLKLPLANNDFTPQSFLALKEDEIDHETHRKARFWINQFRDRGLGDCSGYFLQTGQRAIRIKMNQNLPFEVQTAIKDFWPYILPFDYNRNKRITNKDNSPLAFVAAKVAPIFEHNLSYRRRCSLISTTDDKDFYVCLSDRVCHSADNLIDALEYVYNYFPYEWRVKS